MCWGFECGDGWYRIIERLSADVTRGWRKLPKKAREEFEVVQVKSKFGSLSFYTTAANTEIKRAIQKWTAASCVTCETCGKAESQTNASTWSSKWL